VAKALLLVVVASVVLCVFFCFSAESRENQSMERHGRAAAATPAEAAQHRGRTKFNEIQEKGGEERSWGRRKKLIHKKNAKK